MRSFKTRTRKFRGNHTAGWGRTQRHRKKGKRAGRGVTTGRFKSNKSYFLKQKKLGFPEPEWKIGKNGFKRPQDMVRIYNTNAMNLKDLDYKLDNLVQEKKASKTGTTYMINLKDLNVQKLLGRGEIKKKVNITVDKASENAVEKVKAAGGKVTLIVAEASK